jgi:hypothetical protein
VYLVERPSGLRVERYLVLVVLHPQTKNAEGQATLQGTRTGRERQALNGKKRGDHYTLRYHRGGCLSSRKIENFAAKFCAKRNPAQPPAAGDRPHRVARLEAPNFRCGEERRAKLAR